MLEEFLIGIGVLSLLLYLLYLALHLPEDMILLDPNNFT